MGMTKIATCSYPGSYALEESLERHLAYIDEAADAGCALVVFPESSLQGYPPLPDFTGGRHVAGSRNPTAESTFAGAEPVPSGPSVSRIAQRAAARNIHVVYGLNEAGDSPGVIYNTAVLTGPDGHIGAYRKVHVHALESIVWRHGRDFPVFDTAIGRIGIMICYDKWWPESARELTLRGADLLIAPAAWICKRPDDPQGSDFLDRTFRMYDRMRALENSRWVVSSNYHGELGGLYYGGLSEIVDPLGEIAVTTGNAPGLAIAEVDLAAGVRKAAASMRGARLIRDRRPEAYRALRGEVPVAIDG